ncbi:MAG: PHP domain-containing protein [Candidatus Eremiobacteraeota bacterium]|nr:PHP domain-containing protein [Candidatus Eremiobacteraeota bacterium]
MIVDFHCHTLKSDGSLTPSELSAAMRARGVSIFSITDHDTLDAYGNFDPPPNTTIVTGIEINTTYHDSEVHVLGFGLPLGESALSEVLAKNRDERRIRVGKMVEQLQNAGYPITMELVEAQAQGGKALGRPHVGKALIAGGHVSDIQSAFRELLIRGKPGYVPAHHITPHRAIDLICAVGGIPVLAHPGRLKDYDLIDEFAAAGLRGLEVFYPTHERGQVQYFRDKAKRYNLVMSAGSDFHDIRYNKRGVGMDVEPADIAPFLKLLDCA